jgi:hypothetical protein
MKFTPKCNGMVYEVYVLGSHGGEYLSSSHTTHSDAVAAFRRLVSVDLKAIIRRRSP